MKKYLRWSIIIPFLLLCAICSICSFMFYAEVIDDNYSCFDMFSPTSQRVAERTHIRLPESATNIEWHCLYAGFEGYGVALRFDIPPEDARHITTDPEYERYRDGDFFDDFFYIFNGTQMPMIGNIENYSLWQGNSSCGWTNVVIDMDTHDVFTVYAVFNEWEHCPNELRNVSTALYEMNGDSD